MRINAAVRSLPQSQCTGLLLRCHASLVHVLYSPDRMDDLPPRPLGLCYASGTHSVTSAALAIPAVQSSTHSVTSHAEGASPAIQSSTEHIPRVHTLNVNVCCVGVQHRTQLSDTMRRKSQIPTFDWRVVGKHET